MRTTQPRTAARGHNLADDKTNTYYYDFANHLVCAVRQSDSDTIGEYTYDALGRRVKKVVADVSDTLDGTTLFYYDGLRVIEQGELDGSNNYVATHQYVWGLYLDELMVYDYDADADGNFDAIDEANGDTRYYVAHDFLYSTHAVVDSSGTVQERYDYAPYGRATFWTADYTDTGDETQVHLDFLFTGQRFDPETGLYHYKFRAHHPTLGRFLQREPLGYFDGMSFYPYAVAAPLRFMDPTGLAVVYWTPDKGWPRAMSWRDVLDTLADLEQRKNVSWANRKRDPATAWLYKQIHYMKGRVEFYEARYKRAVYQWELDFPGEPCPITREDYGPVLGADPEVLAEQRALLTGVLSLSLRVGIEAYDWGATGYAWSRGDFSWWDLLGLLPFVSAGVGRFADDVHDLGKGMDDFADLSKHMDDVGDLGRTVGEAKQAFASNKAFRTWFHRHYKNTMKMSGGGIRNPDLPDKELLEAYLEWIDIGRP